MPDFTFDVLAKLLRTGAPRVWQNFYGDPVSRDINSGGFWQAQMGKALYYLRAWGDSLNEALRRLPTESGLAVAAHILHWKWSKHPSLRPLLSEYFDDLDEVYLQRMERYLTQVLLDTELEWLLMELGKSERTITLEDCLNGSINLKGIRMLILSACETSIIDIRQAADEVLGMAAGFLQVGTAGVIASLWAVDDHATYLLMSRFMQLFLDPEHHQWSPARCLAEAQKWLREEATNKVLAIYDPIQAPVISETRSLRFSAKRASIEIREQAKVRNPEALPYADPFYWVDFRLQDGKEG